MHGSRIEESVWMAPGWILPVYIQPAIKSKGRESWNKVLIEAHIANLRRLGEMGKLVLNGLTAEVQELISTDPMVRVGRLVFELHTWMVEKNILP